MDIDSMIGPAPEGVPDGPTTLSTVAYLRGLAVADLDESVEVLAVLAVQVGRAIDRAVGTGQAVSVVPNMARQLRETLGEIRALHLPVAAADDPFAKVQAEALGVTPSLFLGGPSS